MKKALALGVGVFSLWTMAGVARADQPAKQEGRVWIDQNFLLQFSPEWSWTTMPGARAEFARSRESKAGVHFVEFFFGPNYTYRRGNLTLKGSIWYYYMGYPGRGREQEVAPYNGTMACTTAGIGIKDTCNVSTYNFSHNVEIVPTGEYRFGRWSIYDRVIFHNTFYADTYATATGGMTIDDQRWGLGTVLRELLQVRYGLTDKMGVFLSDEVFLGIKEDSDTSKIADGKGYRPAGYWKSGLRYNRTYLGVDYKIAPNFTISPMYMVEVGLSPVDSGDITDIAHTIFIVSTVSAATFGNK
jgi:hypothetical protein